MVSMTEPENIQRLVVVLMVSLCFGTSADTTRLAFKLSSSEGSLNDLVGGGCLWMMIQPALICPTH